MVNCRWGGPIMIFYKNSFQVHDDYEHFFRFFLSSIRFFLFKVIKSNVLNTRFQRWVIDECFLRQWIFHVNEPRCIVFTNLL